MIAVAAIAIIAIAFAIGGVSRDGESASSNLGQQSVSSLERRLTTIDGNLHSLAKPSMRTGVGAVGYRSLPQSDQNQAQWIKIELAEEVVIDQIVLVPAIWRDSNGGFRADGFPLEFIVRVGSDNDEEAEGTIVASYSANDSLLPRVAPVVVSFPAIVARWVRVEASVLSTRGWDGKHILQMAEIFVFSGQQNVALHQRVYVSSCDPDSLGTPRHKNYLVDGFVPYLMDASDGEQSLAFVGKAGSGESPTITIDLESTRRLNGIRLHAIDLSDTVPQAKPEDFGIPRRMIVEGANRADFSDAKPLMEYRVESAFDAGPIIMRRFPDVKCRYVRFVATEPYDISSAASPQETAIGFAEIEILCDGWNLAMGKTSSANFLPMSRLRSLTTLTDGYNLYGRILPIRQWFGELARRHDLETERPRIAAELKQRYQLQKANLNRLRWMVGLLVFVVACTIGVERVMRRRALIKTREQIAADLHDELGANLHAIGLLGDLAQTATESPERLKEMLIRIRELTQRSGAAARYCTNMLESEGLFGDLVDDMQRTSARFLADMDHQLTFEGEDLLRRLKPPIRVGLLLFYKECLTNILRHAHATRVSTCLKTDSNELRLMVTDNGCGLSESQPEQIPKSLRRRAHLLGAKVSAIESADSGTTVTLHLRLNRITVI
ncbi:Nitrate/nitrite sensor protein NarX [Novipirellula aureliae]|uniref:Nitrate/nitrite sensor protein NarX n=1 Tax=Novipirellula aureliae TaxID=2527966 RepID=A0A5C6E8Q0_9BACT|nr:histidine kinase [Novipirellula aureliae]TWU44307.1 Nitrate/nitrite sensor protein NarX [Novipirellula aureliae]